LPRIQDVKERVMLTSAFGQKTAALCAEAAAEEKMQCRQLAADRLFCALLSRHAEKYQGMDGVAEEKERCEHIDIMETAVEAAKDARDQEEAAPRAPRAPRHGEPPVSRWLLAPHGGPARDG